MTSNQGITFAYIVSLVGGLIITITSIINVLWYSSGAPNFGGYGSYIRGLMGGYHNFMGSLREFLWFSCWNLAGSRDLRRRCGDERYNAKGSSARAHDLGNRHYCVFSS